MTDRPQGPLSDVLVVDLTHALSGPYCTPPTRTPAPDLNANDARLRAEFAR